VSAAALTAILSWFPVASAPAAEVSTDDFKFDGPNGSHGASVERLAKNHFKITLGHAPEHPDWCNMLYFQIVRNARGNRLRVDVEFPGGNAYRFNHNACTWSYDREQWRAIKWCDPENPSRRGDSLLFPEFTEDVVHFGAQVPISYEEVVELLDGWEKHPAATLHRLGKSLGGRTLYRVEITDPDPRSPHPPAARWVHWFGNQHPGEHNAQWRMVGMIRWLLSDAGADCRRRSICHFVLMTSPDGPHHGWYRVNAQGVDMNRSYFAKGADPKRQAHEACVVQQDFEKLMDCDAPVTTVWSMHTWAGQVEPILLRGPEIGSVLGPWEEFKDVLLKHDPQKLVEPLKIKAAPGGAETNWNEGPHVQFGVTNVLCEGSGDWTSKQRCLDAGVVLIKGIAEYYRGTRPTR